MATIVRMPEIAANTSEALLATWLVSESTAVTATDPIATVETDKAAVDIEAETGGVLLKTLVPEGAYVSVGAPIAVLGEPGEQLGDLQALLGPAAVPEPAAPTEPAVAVHEPPQRIFASPLVRRLAVEAGLRLEDMRGTGPGGRIVRRDVEAAMETASRHAAPPSAPVAAEPVADDRTGLPHSRMRAAIAARLTESKQTIPHFYLRGSCRVGRLLELRAELNAEGTVKISVNDLIVKAAARAHTLVPKANVQWTPTAVQSFSTVDIAIAVSTGDGLVTPVARAVERTSVATLAAQTRDLAARARAGRLRPEELDGGSLTVTNLGMYGTEEFAAIINPPQAAILAVGAAKQQPIVHDGELAVGTVMHVTLSVDHRPIDGTVAAEWLRTFTSLIENPLQILV